MSSLSTVGERRLVLRMLDHWDNLRGDRRFPKMSEIDPDTIGTDWPYCFLFRVGEHRSASLFQYVGEQVLHDSELPLSWLASEERSLAHCPDGSLLSRAIGHWTQVSQRRVPISMGDVYADQPYTVKYRSILLPMSSDGEQIDAIVGAVNSRRAKEDTLALTAQAAAARSAAAA